MLICTSDIASTDQTLETCLAVIDAGWATTDQLRQAVTWRRTARPQIGNLAMTYGILTVGQVFEILDQQAVTGGLFGQIGVQLGLLSKTDLQELLELQSNLTPTLADALVTLGIISPNQRACILNHGSSNHASTKTPNPCGEPSPQ
jgi:hypothetical protein